MEVEAKGANERLNNLVAITVVVISVFMALSNIKSGNNGQAMALATASAVDTWSEYQATRLKQHLAENALAQLALSAGQTGANAALVSAEHVRLDAAIKKYTAKSATLMAQAKGFEAEYNTLNMHDDQFDMAEAFLSMALALAAVAVFTNLPWLLYVSWGVSGIGFVMGLAGFLKLNLHSEFVANLLG